MNCCPIPGLFFHRGPPTIFRGIPLRVVDSIYGQIICITRLFRPFVESIKRSPIFTNGNSFSPIVLLIRVFASFVHVAPARMNPSPLHSVCCSSLSNSRTRPFTPTGKTFPGSEITSSDYLVDPTRASTLPQSASTFCVSRFRNNKPFAKFLARKFNQFRIFSHG